MAHKPVMLATALTHLAIKPTGVYLDCTFGRGGHSTAILNTLNESGRLIAFDRDLTAINSENAQTLRQDPRFTLIHCPFSQLSQQINSLGLQGQLDGILMDLGVSSPQLDNPERGFSFLRDGALDMRMDNSTGLSAAQYLATIDEASLVKVLFDYGEERFARRIANAIISTRLENPITTTRQLASLVDNAVPFKEKHKHPATRTFQALRIAINGELDELQSVLGQAVEALKPQGRLVVIAFHSLEDRIVKRFIREQSGTSQHIGKLPIKEVDIAKGSLKKIGKALRATREELDDNPRARSAVLRVAEKI
ncbi:MAG: 16S rRNA (cytosine(1402)-N(4))-methyltransferase RsmH [Methylococcaceae bacterium]